jgi:hypothetical protein
VSESMRSLVATLVRAGIRDDRSTGMGRKVYHERRAHSVSAIPNTAASTP